MNDVGILGYGFYLPESRMSAADIAAATGGNWSEAAVRDKLGIVGKSIPGPEDGTQEMGARAALDAIARSGIDPLEIDLILCMGEEWKEYPLTTSAIYIQERIGAHRAWGIDIQQRCNTSVAAIKIAKDMLIADPEIATVMIVGGYRNGDLIDFRDSAVSFMFDLAAGAGALLLRRDLGRNRVLGSHIITDGSLARDVGVWYGGTEHPIETLPEAELAALRARGNLSLRVFEPEHMKARLNEVSMPNWLACIDKALAKSGATRADIDFLNALLLEAQGGAVGVSGGLRPPGPGRPDAVDPRRPAPEALEGRRPDGGNRRRHRLCVGCNRRTLGFRGRLTAAWVTPLRR
jgi:3-oxoacyl-[acyl-carrier-protein] synthase-3